MAPLVLLAACNIGPPRPLIVRPVRMADPARPDTIIPGLRSRLASDSGPPVRMLTVHGMIQRRPGFSDDWLKRLTDSLGLASTLRDSVDLKRGYRLFVHSNGSVIDTLEDDSPSIVRITDWKRQSDSTRTVLVVYELTWAPLRDEVKQRFLACFEARSRPGGLRCPEFAAGAPQRNTDRQEGINGLIKDRLLIYGFGDASIVLSPLADVLRQDVNATMCLVALDILGSAVRSVDVRAIREGCPPLQAARDSTIAGGENGAQANGAATAPLRERLSAGAFVALTHSLGSFLLMDAQQRAESPSATADVHTESRRLAFAPLRPATVYMFANQVSLLNLARLSFRCESAGGASCPASTRTSVAALDAQREAFSALRTTWVAFNDVSDLLGFELPPYLEHVAGLGTVVNVSVANPVITISRLLKDPGGAHTDHSANRLVVRSIVDGLPIPQPGAPRPRPPRVHAGILGAHVDDRVGFSLTAGVLAPLSCRPRDHCGRHETSIVGSVGFGPEHGRAGVGLMQGFGPLGTALSARASMLRRWGTSSKADYWGMELTLNPLLFLGVRFGYYRAFDEDVRRRILRVWGLSVGL